MRAYCITLKDNAYSEAAAARCVQSAAKHGLEVHRWNATSAAAADTTMHMLGLKWNWAHDNTRPAVCRTTGLKQHPYKTADQRMRIGCSMSHYFLWEKACTLGEPILILEHDAVFVAPLPEIDFVPGAIMINSPIGATPRGHEWADRLKQKGKGMHLKTPMHRDAERIPDGLAGGSAYIIAPHAAAACMAAYKYLGVWPNDATLCRQLIGGLCELYPWVTEVRADKSMAGGY